MQVVQLCNRDL